MGAMAGTKRSTSCSTLLCRLLNGAYSMFFEVNAQMCKVHIQQCHIVDTECMTGLLVPVGRGTEPDTANSMSDLINIRQSIR
jgi:hypothetical protein